jgi:hypothetical protein
MPIKRDISTMTINDLAPTWKMRMGTTTTMMMKMGMMMTGMMVAEKAARVHLPRAKAGVARMGNQRPS